MVLFFFVSSCYKLCVWHARAASFEHAPGRHRSMNAGSMPTSQTRGKRYISTLSCQSSSAPQQPRSREKVISTACRLQHGRRCKPMLGCTSRTTGTPTACSLDGAFCTKVICTPVSACSDTASAMTCVVACSGTAKGVINGLLTSSVCAEGPGLVFDRAKPFWAADQP